jgi:transposase, IS30 family
VVAMLSALERRQVRELARRGASYREVVAAVGRSSGAVGPVIRDERGGGRAVQLIDWEPGPGRLTMADREEIAAGLQRGESFTMIAARLGRVPSTVSREVHANGGRSQYRASKAHRRAWARARRPKTAKLAGCERLQAAVIEGLERLWSPQQITRRLLIEFPHDPMMRVSHETIYQSLYVQGRGALRRELARCLRSGRAQRRHRGRDEKRGRIPGMVMISDRPADIADRAVPGHWEGDLIIGLNGASAVATLVERATRYVLLARITDQTAETVRDAITTQIIGLPAHLRRSLTWDQGKEMSSHTRFSIDTGVAVYFCDPHSPWQRGSNENTNGLLRQYMPKGTDLSPLTQTDLDRIAASLNNRPRQTLDWLKPSEKLAELLAHTG